MKRRFALPVALVSSLALSILTGCGSSASDTAVVGPDGLQADGNYAKPDGCSQNDASNQCEECTDECTNPYAPDDGFDTCESASAATHRRSTDGAT